MRLRFLQHVAFEGPASVAVWAAGRGHALSTTRLFAGEPLPSLADFDLLVVLGGPMNVYQEEACPWLTGEKRFIKQAIMSQKIVLGICLGAQLIADALGARVYKSAAKEIGWWSVALAPEAKASPLFSGLPDRFIAFHWHGDTFDVPAGAIRTAGSDACPNQAFVYGNRVVGLQFHLESSLESIDQLIANCGDELVDGEFIQPRERLRSLQDVAAANKLMAVLLDNLAAQAG